MMIWPWHTSIKITVLGELDYKYICIRNEIVVYKVLTRLASGLNQFTLTQFQYILCAIFKISKYDRHEYFFSIMKFLKNIFSMILVEFSGFIKYTIIIMQMLVMPLYIHIYIYIYMTIRHKRAFNMQLKMQG